ncbi:MAG: nucleoside kinase [Blautia sp.]|nr:nucleoside kinase [Blautia sp.]
MTEKERIAKTEAEEYWGGLGIDSPEDLNRWIRQGESQRLVDLQEDYQEKKLEEMVLQILSDEKIRTIWIAGPSSSGKTSFAGKLARALEQKGRKTHSIGLDDYFVDRDDCPLDEEGKKDFESLNAVDVALFSSHMETLAKGGQVDLPTYNFLTGKREYRGNRIRQGKGEYILVEGIHALNPEISGNMAQDEKLEIFACPVYTLKEKDGENIPPRDMRMIRRIVRDSRLRGYKAEQTIAMWESVVRGERKHIFPYRQEADLEYDTSFIYELAILKSQIMPQIRDLPEEGPVGSLVARLRDLCALVTEMPPVKLPEGSIIREFVG